MDELKTNHIRLMSESEFFYDLTEHQISVFIKACEIITLIENDIVFHQGSKNDEMFFILSGSITLLMDPELLLEVSPGSTSKHPVAVLEAGKLFGEMAHFDKKPRSATAIARENGTVLLKITPGSLDIMHTDGLKSEEVQARQIIFRNLIKQLSNKIRFTNQLVAKERMAGSFLTTMVNELLSEDFNYDLLNPVINTLAIQNPESFFLSSLIAHELKSQVIKEIIDVHIFARPDVLKNLLSAKKPAGESILYTLLFFIRTGNFPEKAEKKAYQIQLIKAGERRTGVIKIKKWGQKNPFILIWKIKGIIKKKQHLYGNLFITVYPNQGETVVDKVLEIINGYSMPLQDYLFSAIKKTKSTRSSYRVLMIHHRTHEVIATLQKLKRSGIILDRFIGIPYGNANWETNGMLNEVSQNRYMVLKAITSSNGLSRYVFDFKSSSYLSRSEERALLQLSNKHDTSTNYMRMMQRLVTHCLIQALSACEKYNQRLILYEDGGYLASIIYKIYYDSNDQHFNLIRQALKKRLIVGIVEGTLSGHRKHINVIEHQEKPLLPVLSSARSLIKKIYESKGIAESIIHSAATALGRLGLSTFFGRKIAVVGGNGVIGTRLVEQLTHLQGDTANIFVVDIQESPFKGTLSSTYSYLKKSIQYADLPRFFIDESITLIDYTAFKAFDDFFKFLLLHSKKATKLAVLNFPGQKIASLQQKLKKKSVTPLKIVTGKFSNFNHLTSSSLNYKELFILPSKTILATKKIFPLVMHCCDVIIGMTGNSVINAMDLVGFLKRKTKEKADELILISGSSKDIEFKKCIFFLDAFLEMQLAKRSTHQVRKNFVLYKKEYTALANDYAPLLNNLIQYVFIEDLSLQELLQKIPELTKIKDDLEKSSGNLHDKLFNFMRSILFDAITIEKIIKPDIGISYIFQIGEDKKIIHLLANGLVINFFAQHEKGAKSEYIDPIMTLQFLCVLHMAQNNKLVPGLYDGAEEIDKNHLEYMWSALNSFHSPSIINVEK